MFTAPKISKSHVLNNMVLYLHQTSRKPIVGQDRRNAVGPTISKYISDRMSGKTYKIFERTGD